MVEELEEINKQLNTLEEEIQAGLNKLTNLKSEERANVNSRKNPLVQSFLKTSFFMLLFANHSGITTSL
jgi:septation ring formation regulator EzrA